MTVHTSGISPLILLKFGNEYILIFAFFSTFFLKTKRKRLHKKGLKNAELPFLIALYVLN